MKAKPSKSRIVYIKASSGKVCDAQLSIVGEKIQEVRDSEFQVLRNAYWSSSYPNGCKNHPQSISREYAAGH